MASMGMATMGIPHEMFCTLCGVRFWLHEELIDYEGEQNDMDWFGYYVALRTPQGMTKDMASGSDGKWFLSGVGQQDTEQPRIPPPGYDIRDVLKGKTKPSQNKLKGSMTESEKRQSKLRRLMNESEKREWESFEKPFGVRHSKSFFYCMHLRCWDILQQQHALIAPPSKTLDLNELGRLLIQIPLIGKGMLGAGYFKPDWTNDFTGPERFANIEENFSDDGIFTTHDPGIAYGFDELLANPPLETAATISPRIQFTDDGGDVFARLPEEILTEILVLLPSASARDVKLASKKMASVHLSSRYWRSRFDFPNELCHVKLPPALLKSGQVGERWVDWRCLCDQLLHPVGDGFERWQNRKRITVLNRKLVKSMPLRRSDGSLK